MSNLTVIITLCSLVAGFVTQAVNTGSLFGMVTVPKAWLPYASLIGTLLAGFAGNLSQAAAVNGTTILAAVMAGVMALTGTAVGVTCHQHLKAHLGMGGKPANDNAAKKDAPPAAA